MSFITKNGKTAEEFEAELDQVLATMAHNQKTGNYVEAESNRVKSQQLRKQLDLRRVYEMQVRHKDQIQEINKAHQEEMGNFNNFWDKKMQDYEAEGARLERQLIAKHAADLDKQRQELEKQHPLKVKQSSECLNLRKMEQHMVKQKNYVQAHKVQQRIQELEKAQKNQWLQNRELKIQTALNTMRAKQSAELGNLQKRIKTGKDEQTKDRFNEQNRLKTKFMNIMKQLKMQQEKQVLALQGKFKSKGGQNSPIAKSKFLHTGLSK